MAQLNAKGSLLAGIIAGVGASVCCVGPLVLMALGISGAWIGNLTALEPYRPFFIGLTLLVSRPCLPQAVSRPAVLRSRHVMR